MMTVSDRTLIGIAAMLATALSLAGTNAYIGGGGDNAGYIAQAQSLVETGERRDISQADSPLATLQPPLFPYMLAGVVALFGVNVLAMKILVSVFVGLSVLAAGWAVKASRSGASDTLPLAGLLALWFALSPTLHRYSHDVLSDVPFAAAALASVALAGEFIKRGGVLRGVLVVVALIAATEIRSAGLIMGGGLLLYAAAEALYKPQRRRAIVLAGVLLLTLLTLTLLTARGGTTYFGHLQGSAPSGAAESLLGRIGRVAQYYAVFLPVEILGYAGLGPEEAIYCMAALGTGSAILGAVILWRRSERLIAVTWIVYQAGLLAWPFVDARFFLPIVPMFMWLAATGGVAILQRAAVLSRVAAGVVALLLTLFPILGIVGTILQALNPEIEGATVVEWSVAAAGAIAAAVWITRVSESVGIQKRAFGVLGALLATLLMCRVVIEEIVPQRDRDARPGGEGYGDLYDASLWLKEHAQTGDLVVSSKVPLVWHWSGGLKGVLIPKETNAAKGAEAIQRARWAILDGLQEDGVSWRYLRPILLLRTPNNSWRVAWQQEKTTVLVRVDSAK